MNIIVYGIPNCDTVRKARSWLGAKGLYYVFHDYKQAGIDEETLREWMKRRGWEALLNRKGPTFRKLPEDTRSNLDDDKAVRLMIEHTSAIKRPVVEYPGGLLVGFEPAEWSKSLARGR
jgi:arsenate reductase (glutaredoxin)